MQRGLAEILRSEIITPRRRQLLALAETGATNRQIAVTLHLAEGSGKYCGEGNFSKTISAQSG